MKPAALAIALSFALAFTALCGLSLPLAAQETPAAVRVQLSPLSGVWQQPQREAAAEIVPRNASRLSAETSGVLQRWTADVGARVQRGQVLAQIDPRDAELAVQRARAALQASDARLKLAQAQLQRSRDLVAQGFFSQEALAQRETEVALAQSERSANQAQLDTAQRQLAKTTLRAPFSGIVTERHAQTGEAVAPGTPLYVLADTSAGEISADIAPSDVPGLRSARDARFVPQDAGQAELPLRLLRVTGTVTAPARTQTVRLAAVNGTAPPPPGTSGTLRWTEAQPHLPPQYVVRRGSALGLFTVREGRARFVALPQAQEGRAALVALPPDTPVVTHGQAALQDGMAVNTQ